MEAGIRPWVIRPPKNDFERVTKKSDSWSVFHTKVTGDMRRARTYEERAANEAASLHLWNGLLTATYQARSNVCIPTSREYYAGSGITQAAISRFIKHMIDKGFLTLAKKGYYDKDCPSNSYAAIYEIDDDLQTLAWELLEKERAFLDNVVVRPSWRGIAEKKRDEYRARRKGYTERRLRRSFDKAARRPPMAKLVMHAPSQELLRKINNFLKDVPVYHPNYQTRLPWSFGILTRKFTDDFSHNGRWHSILQNVASKHRAALHVGRPDGEKLAVIDVGAMHATILLALHGVQSERDFYLSLIPISVRKALDAEELRLVRQRLKYVVNIGINISIDNPDQDVGGERKLAKIRQTLYAHAPKKSAKPRRIPRMLSKGVDYAPLFKDKSGADKRRVVFGEDAPTKRRPFRDAADIAIAWALVANHPVIAPYMATGKGLELMNMESNWLGNVMSKLVDEGVYFVPLHDAVAVPESMVDLAGRIMHDEFKAMFGTTPWLAVK